MLRTWWGAEVIDGTTIEHRILCRGMLQGQVLQYLAGITRTWMLL